MIDIDEIYSSNCKCYVKDLNHCFFIKRIGLLKCIPGDDCLKFMNDDAKILIKQYNRKNKILKLKGKPTIDIEFKKGDDVILLHTMVKPDKSFYKGHNFKVTGKDDIGYTLIDDTGYIIDNTYITYKTIKKLKEL